MKILVVNDDGINAIGIKYLVDELINFGEVYVVAPAYQQSAKSHYINCFTKIKFEEVEFENAKKAYKLYGSPADCVRVGIDLFDFDFDLVVSGVNNGANLGYDILYSGTVAAALEATVQGIKALAISTCYGNFDIVKNELNEVLKTFIPHASNEYLLNINFPEKSHLKSIGYKFTTMGEAIFETKYRITNSFAHPVGNKILKDHGINTDNYNYFKGYTTITPILINRTATEKINYLSKMFNL